MAEAKIVKIDIKKGIRQFTVRCPFCGREHMHEGGLANEDVSKYLGHRLSQCRSRDQKQYRIVLAD